MNRVPWDLVDVAPQLRPHRRATTLLIVLAALLTGSLGACVPPSGSGEAQRSATAGHQTPTAEAGCPNPHGGVCLGALDAGTYSTKSFSSALTYTVPEGWANYEDLPGNVLLNRQDAVEVDDWGGSYIGVYQNVRAADRCWEDAQPGIGTSAAELVAWYRTVEGLEIVAETPASVGGLSGTALDFRVSDDWRSECPLGGSVHAVPIIIGGGVSDLHHVMGAPLDMRLILLDWEGGNVAIEVTALREQHSLADYLGAAGAGSVIESFKFGS